MTEEQLRALRKAKAIEKDNKAKWVKHFGAIPNTSGIYILTRQENGFKYAYIGQAKHILTRLADHLKASCGIYDKNTQHIDNSLKKHGLYSKDNITGWQMACVTYDIAELNEQEQYFIKIYANAGYQLRNKTAGGQGEGKFKIAETKEKKGYLQGLHNGYEKARKEIAKLFEKNLTYAINGKPNKNKEKAKLKFEEFIQTKNN